MYVRNFFFEASQLLFKSETLLFGFSNGDELIIADINLDLCKNYKETLFDFERYRKPETYGRITTQSGAIVPEET